MIKLKMETEDLTQKNIKVISSIFPHVVTEVRGVDGNIKRVVDFDLLRQELSDEIVEGEKERYQLNWPGKKEAILLTNNPIDKTLRPIKSDSVNWESTQNVYIEGENLEVLKLLNESYLNKVKTIFIDPPYNTGKDFLYKDDFSISVSEYSEEAGLVDDEKNRLFINPETNGRFHSVWLTNMYSRLRLAKNLLRRDGVLFISIDDNEYANMKRMCDEIFDEKNYLGTIIWKKKTNGNNMGAIPPVHDYIVVYAKNKDLILDDLGYPADERGVEGYSNPDNDPRGLWKTMDLSANHKGPHFKITNPENGQEHYPPEGRYWVFNEDEVNRRINDGKIIFGKTGSTKPVQKVFLKDREFNRIKAESLWDKQGLNEDATEELKDLFGIPKLFIHPKPTELLLNIVKIATKDRNGSELFLDFFSGSSTTAHAVMMQNAIDKGNRRFIMVQIPEDLNESLKTASNDIKPIIENAINYLESINRPALITEIGKERIRKSITKINETYDCDADLGFRVFRLDESNMKDVYYKPSELTPELLKGFESSIKEDRTGEDLLIQVLLECGLELSLPMETKNIDGKTVHFVGGNSLIACFEDQVSEGLVIEIAKEKPLRAVFRDSSFKNDAERINLEEHFKRLSPSTDIRVL